MTQSTPPRTPPLISITVHFYRFSDPASNEKGYTASYNVFVGVCAYIDLSDADQRTRFPALIRPAIQPEHGDLLGLTGLPAAQKQKTISGPRDWTSLICLFVFSSWNGRAIFVVHLLLGAPPSPPIQFSDYANLRLLPQARRRGSVRKLHRAFRSVCNIENRDESESQRKIGRAICQSRCGSLYFLK
jgi:hypothetical protein